MMPTIAASTGAAFLPSASPAARPSSTTSTFSCTPAPTPSTARQRRAARRVVEVQRLHQQQLGALELPVLLRRRPPLPDDAIAICIVIDLQSDPDSSTSSDRRCRRCRRRPEARRDRTGKLASLPRTKNTSSPTPAPTASDGDERPADRLVIGRQRLHDEQLDADEAARPCGWPRRRR